jgi:predicted TIM-barrel fold metal-dependent hydrolase
MEQKALSRRTLLRAGGTALAGAVLGIGAWEGFRYLSGGTGPKPPAVKPIIDTHVHLVNPNLPGVPHARTPDGLILGEGPPEPLARSILAQMTEADVEHVLCMPSKETDEKDPLGVEATRGLARLVGEMTEGKARRVLHPVGFADPERFDDQHLQRVEDELKKGDVKAFKAYLGYLHHGPEDGGYRPYYRLAEKYAIPVIFHTGDNYSQKAKVKYAHPLAIDEVAVDFPGTNFVIAHLGNPWLMDAAEVIYKNNKDGKDEVKNVWADLSALVIGSAADFENYRKQGALKTVIEEVRKALEFAERPDRFLFGSDWPLSPLGVYRDFIRELVPAQHHQAVFYDNAKALFKL